MTERLVPELPKHDTSLRLLIDTDAANEIDDLYAIALALAAPERFRLQGFVATHFATWAGPDSTEQSYQLILEELRAAGCETQFPVEVGGHPMQYQHVPSPSAGADLIIECARAGQENDPLWIVALGAATNVASALLQAPDIAGRIRVIFHARNEDSWPERTTQFNVMGDVIAVQNLLASDAPLIWFDTGTALTLPMQDTAARLAPLGELGRFLHEFRHRKPAFASPTKGFFDLGDIAWLINPAVCMQQIVPAPRLHRYCHFDHERGHGHMLRVFNIDPVPTWALFFEHMQRFNSGDETPGASTAGGSVQGAPAEC